MTFSILIHDRERDALGGAAVTGNLAVGAWVLALAADAGAVASQGLSVSPLWRGRAMALLQQGLQAERVLQSVVESDPGRGHRQLALLDRQGRSAVWTGDDNRDVKGARRGEDFVISGNWLETEDVLSAIETACRTTAGSPLERRLLSCLEAGVGAGGDARGVLSAALKIVSPGAPPLDLRVDFDDDPLRRLHDLVERTRAPDYAAWLETLPTLKDPYRC